MERQARENSVCVGDSVNSFESPVKLPRCKELKAIKRRREIKEFEKEKKRFKGAVDWSSRKIVYQETRQLIVLYPSEDERYKHILNMKEKCPSWSWLLLKFCWWVLFVHRVYLSPFYGENKQMKEYTINLHTIAGILKLTTEQWLSISKRKLSSAIEGLSGLLKEEHMIEHLQTDSKIRTVSVSEAELWQYFR